MLGEQLSGQAGQVRGRRRRRWWGPRLVTGAGFLLAGCSLTASLDAGSVSVGARSSHEVVYVANADSGPVTVYRAGSAGRVHPVRTINDPGLNGTSWDPWTVTLDASSNVYVQSFLSDATTFVFRPGLARRPAGVFSATTPDSQSIAVDAQGYEYVMGGEAVPQVSVAAPHASGHARSLYGVSPVRQFRVGQATFAPWPSTLTAGSHGDILVAVVRASGNAIEVYRGGASGSPVPVRTISGPRTGLGSCAGFAACAQVSIAYSPFTGRIYAAVSTPSGAHISVFADGASGDARPVRTIAGSRTGLTGKVISGIADSQLTGDIYVMVKDTRFGGPGSVEVFGRLAHGNVRALRSFTDSSSRFRSAEGIAVAG